MYTNLKTTHRSTTTRKKGTRMTREEMNKPCSTKGYLDFYINTNKNWMLEFLVQGKKLQEHMDRFSPEGKYREIKRTEWLVVDFRDNSIEIKQSELKKDGLTIISCDFKSSQATIYECGAEAKREQFVVNFSGSKIMRTLSDL
eukprot:TRINITY_DN4096_c0_g1_i1.p2 TRINITY_DN4096_c0_g1~~TRINITY_DN4096_c0_g1_i1.p2  ORF type:complete len:143 (-),score=5.40 TRINITY_DN4096_c0_g1_i1:84-512(-)